MRRSLVRRSPADLLHRHHLPLGILGIISLLAIQQPHPRLIKGLARDVAVIDRQLMTLGPRDRLAVTLAPRPHTMSIDLTIRILPPLLKQDINLRLIAALKRLLRRKARSLHPRIDRRHINLIVEHQSDRPLRIRHAHLHLSERRLRVGDRLIELTQEDRPRHHHIHIDDAQGLHLLHLRLHLGHRVPVDLSRRNRVGSLHNPGDLSIHIARRPRRAA